ncbi:hypothetical protein SAMN05421678_12630 [Actinopolymorpha cephalotaxi]|uniref:Uncharacterized protein n=1 Tax=Actinopolymorpha cephalotaxi TaxID=504797 RepID=A0A1I3BRQ2_9ACTN|nr:hypothetical protein [Actinopolymorpha cephalotaxi]NYH83759.1 hypothetical protein [Actinopolymorpha cephalotaxi]SFH64975.1 hypothetical protein SAMN05421678_12630 [Actinopolymorpha cephalotaxi]
MAGPDEQFEVGEIDLRIQPVDDRTLLSPDVLDRVVSAVIARLDERERTQAGAKSDRAMWNSVRKEG